MAHGLVKRAALSRQAHSPARHAPLLCGPTTHRAARGPPNPGEPCMRQHPDTQGIPYTPRTLPGSPPTAPSLPATGSLFAAGAPMPLEGRVSPPPNAENPNHTMPLEAMQPRKGSTHAQDVSHEAVLRAAMLDMRRRRPSAPGGRVPQPCHLTCAAVPQPQAQVQPDGGRRPLPCHSACAALSSCRKRAERRAAGRAIVKY